LEKLYAEISASQQEIIIGLAKSLIPDQSLLPEPGYTVAQIQPKATRVHTSPEDSYQITGQSDTGEKHDYYFTPLFEHAYPKCEVVAMLTESMAIQIEDNQAEVVKQTSNASATSYVWIGLAINKVVEKDQIPFFLGNKIVDEFDKNYHIFHHAKWLLNGDPNKLALSDSYEQQIFSRFRNSFIQVAMPPTLEGVKKTLPSLPTGETLSSALNIKQALCWIKVEFSIGVSHDFLLNNILYPNCIPLVNRRMKDRYVVKSNYDRILLPMPTTDFFLDVYKIQDTKDKEEDTQYKKINFLQTGSQPGTYIIRSASRVRRMDQADASQRIHRLLEVIQDEYSTFKEEGVNRLKEDFEVIEKAMNRIKIQLPDFFRSAGGKSPYFCIANFRSGVSRLHYQYWETQGEAIKHLGDRVGLSVSSNDIKIANSQSIIPIQKGKGALSTDDYINQLKISLLSRGRIMTKGDLELYCTSRYGHLLRVEKISREIIMVEEGQLGRGIVVRVQLNQPMSKINADYIRVELQNDLNAKSAFFTHIKVDVNHEE